MYIRCYYTVEYVHTIPSWIIFSTIKNNKKIQMMCLRSENQLEYPQLLSWEWRCYLRMVQSTFFHCILCFLETSCKWIPLPFIAKGKIPSEKYYCMLLMLEEWSYTPLAVVSRARKTLRVSTTALDRANSGCFVERGRCDRLSSQHVKIPSLTYE
jgi:hypothetical protein